MKYKNVRMKTVPNSEIGCKAVVVLIGIGLGIVLNTGCDPGSSSLADQKTNELAELRSELQAAQQDIKSLEEVKSTSAAQIEQLKGNAEALAAELALAQQELAKKSEESKTAHAKLETVERSLDELTLLATDRQKRIDAAVNILQNSDESPTGDQ